MKQGRALERCTDAGMSFLEDLDPLIAATADRIVYICRKGVINHNQAYWRLNDLLLQGRRGLSDRELL